MGVRYNQSMTSFPTAADLETALQRLGVLTGALPSALANLTNVAVRQWLTDVDIRYWLSTDEIARAEIQAGLLIPHSPIIAINSITSIDGRTFTAGDTSDYVTLPRDRTPIRYLRFRTVWSGTVDLNAKFGWSLTDPVPDDVWHAVLLSAVKLAVNELKIEPAGSITAVRQGDVSLQYSDSESWHAVIDRNYKTTVDRYRLLIM